MSGRMPAKVRQRLYGGHPSTGAAQWKLPGIDPGPPRNAIPPNSEHVEQATLIGMVRIWDRRVPELQMLAAVPNGGYRCPKTSVELKAEGISPGYPDLLLDVARQGRHGLRIEMKTRGNTVTDDQMKWLGRLDANGYRVAVCWTWVEAWRVLSDYLGRPDMLDAIGEASR